MLLIEFKGVAMDSVFGRMRAAAEPTRLRLLALCARAELTVSELTTFSAEPAARLAPTEVACEAGLSIAWREGAGCSIGCRSARRRARLPALAGLVRR